MSQTSLVPTYIIKCALFALLAMALLFSAASVQAASAVSSTEPATAQPEPAETATSTSVRPAATTDADGKPTLATELQPTDQALSAANQQLLSRNAQLQRQVNDLQTQANVLVYESKGQLFLYGAFTVLISLLVGIFISWLVFVRRERW